ncbi:ArsR/SmtB family transcription factor [Mycolicibacterium smegmatis]|uniref:Transcriptional regulator, ArsR family protein n=2 Tax=Mycolicibacterium smegmatis (strain ATCC 700084 / mc(2)155) TaxID=246196 RepID=A0QXQ0_MYCS2|nr:metalloregulator ArsR/SmtB family transcription factor [Mycolicibacterium smegmatis]ABK74350.1 transcriptional regulator, ArsR family protein [Mycolicibacterium smegmatis MC2 155]AFP39765.1 ArsR family transcriptional regulator [Mycolicibacterium smegmatis MC2 155]AIU08524.1 ArsR family transcriptional regulator [Mycolicibacterium smegmatis MC2 155]AIU15149.1 ArsR family transcriptional regulator [Mycolicibacterium smegmatis]AIU21772.1 ArsR family transcriptional regulator [Mycolicibacteriu
MVSTDSFAVLAEPARRDILDQLRLGESSVTELVARLRLSQPSVSKHLKVLREAGFVSTTFAAQRRIYRLELTRLKVVDEWLNGYRAMWTHNLDAFEEHLNTTSQRQEPARVHYRHH